ncbi:MAG: hypothetical protein R3F65_28410 [bacterium]
MSGERGAHGWLWRLGVGVGVLLVLGLIYAGFDWYRAAQIWPDELPTLEPPAPVLPPDPSGEARLAALAAEREGLTPQAERRRALVDAEGAPVVPAEGWPAPSLPATAALDAVLALSGVYFEPKRIDADTPNLIPVMEAADARGVRALRRFVEGDVTGAWGDVRSLVWLGQLLEHGGANLLVTMIGAAIEQKAFHLGHRLLAAGGWDPAAAGVARALDEAGARPSPIVAALTGECLGMDMLFRDMGDSSYEELMAMSELRHPPPPPQAAGQDEEAGEEEDDAGGTWLYDADATRAMHRVHCLALIAAAQQPRSSRSLPVMPELYGGWWNVGQMLDNPVGRILLSISSPVWDRYLGRMDELAARRLRLRLALAKAAYRADTGAEAASVVALVPRWLAVAPVDPMTDAPLGLDPGPVEEGE